MPADRFFVCSLVSQREPCRTLPSTWGTNCIPIQFVFYRGNPPQIGPITISLVPHPGSRENLLSERSKYAEFIGKKLSTMGVPEDNRQAIVVDILEVLEVAVPMLPVLVSIVEVDHGASNSRVNFIPATKSSLESLEKVRLDSLKLEAISSTCVICMEGLAEGGVDKLIHRLPCSHLYHGDCIVNWLETSRLCPLCRYQLPTKP